MPKIMQLEILTPEALIYRGIIDYIQMPGIDGYFGILENHAPLISALGPGEITIDQATEANETVVQVMDESISKKAADKRFTMDVNGGIAEVLNNKVIVLVD
jgi:F-type H+-transporting ATPase subunit epsilon